MNVFEKTLRELFGKSEILSDIKYTGKTCLARLDRDLLVKLEFTDPGTACNFTAISASIINRTEGHIGSIDLSDHPAIHQHQIRAFGNGSFPDISGDFRSRNPFAQHLPTGFND